MFKTVLAAVAIAAWPLALFALQAYFLADKARRDLFLPAWYVFFCFDFLGIVVGFREYDYYLFKHLTALAFVHFTWGFVVYLLALAVMWTLWQRDDQY